MSAGDWGSGTYWRPSYLALQYNANTIVGVIVSYVVHVPSATEYPKTYNYTCPVAQPISAILTVLTNAAGAISNYEGIPLE